ncbi:hypothetical protein OIE66_22770 [Nonomuraea sp. NBC_01738]|uniref:hypothetical protein n=1 Tax=Nonomuraea sp. NBC_01738 TaxID=2976003 RepID=UPI002E15D45A|nr:hypothetical protein OIE66_22770 [Nonomuraea sp. NBC_01738]
MTNPDYPAVAALGVALDLVLGMGVEAIGHRVAETLGDLLDAARGAGARVLHDELPPAERGGIAAFTIPGRDPAAVHAVLGAAGLTTTLRGDWIRLSPHASTPRQAAQRLASTLRNTR